MVVFLRATGQVVNRKRGNQLALFAFALINAGCQGIGPAACCIMGLCKTLYRALVAVFFLRFDAIRARISAIT